MKFYSAAPTDDLRCGLLYLSHKYPNAPLVGLGFSLGANVLTRYLGEEGIRSRLIAGLSLACVRIFLVYLRVVVVITPLFPALGRGKEHVSVCFVAI